MPCPLRRSRHAQGSEGGARHIGKPRPDSPGRTSCKRGDAREWGVGGRLPTKVMLGASLRAAAEGEHHCRRRHRVSRVAGRIRRRALQRQRTPPARRLRPGRGKTINRKGQQMEFIKCRSLFDLSRSIDEHLLLFCFGSIQIFEARQSVSHVPLLSRPDPFGLASPIHTPH